MVGYLDRGAKNMSTDDIVQIKVDKHSVGIMGLRQIFEEMARDFADKPDEEVKTEVLNRLSKRNYIPDSARERYGSALIRQFKKFLGLPCDEDKHRGLEIKILGPGCAQCDSLERELMEVMTALDLPADIDHVRDIKEIGKYGVMGTPALLINDKVKSVGTVPPKSKVIQWLNEIKQ
ncbi:MAG: thioredoxin family protein [Deltaproteobacteria bacterium]|nr:MAG: thioredoxin family protein [Deltaproteobacteria bacterium]